MGSILEKSYRCSLITWQEYSDFMGGHHLCFVPRHKISFAHYEQDFPYTCLLVLFRIWMKCHYFVSMHAIFKPWILQYFWKIWELMASLFITRVIVTSHLLTDNVLAYPHYGQICMLMNLSAFWFILVTTHEVGNGSILFSTYCNFSTSYWLTYFLVSS